jgi:hypothetical protein
MLVTNVKRNHKGKEKTGYYMQGYLKKNLDGVPEFLKKEWDVVGVVTGHGKTGTGKCLKKGSKVLISNGEWKNIEDVKLGDEVISPQTNGTFTYEKVINLHNRFEEDCYDIIETTSKRLLYSCAGNHEVPLFKYNNKTNSYEYNILEAKELYNIKNKSNRIIYSLSSSAIDFKSIEPTIEPYTLGAWLGDGHFRSVRKLGKDYVGGDSIQQSYYRKNGVFYKEHNVKRKTSYGHAGHWINRDIGITSGSLEVVEEISKHYPIMNFFSKKGTTCKLYRFSLNGELSKELIELGLEGKGNSNKFIPIECLRASKEFRLKLLAGLIDTDGYVSKDNSISITTKSKQLAEDIKNLVHSLGGASNISKIHKEIKSIRFTGTYFNVRVALSNATILPLKVLKKKERISKSNYNRTHVYIRAIKSSSSQVYGIEITGKSKLHITDNWMVTHNSTMALQVAYYLAWLMAGGRMIDEEYEKGKFRCVKTIPPSKPVKFSMENIVFTPEELMKKAETLYNKYGPNQVIVYDEGKSGLDSENAMKSINKAMTEFFQRCRVYHHIILIVLPNFFKLHEDYAVARSLFLVDVYSDNEFNRGYFSFYNEYQKEKLFYFGKKLIGVRARYSAAHHSFWGRFTKWIPVDKTEYDKAKMKAIKDISLGKYEQKWKKQRDVALSMIRKYGQLPAKVIAKELSLICNTKIGEKMVKYAIMSVTHEKMNEID